MLRIKDICKRIVYGNKYNSRTYVDHLNKIGAKIDKTVYFVSPKNTLIDETRPYLIEIGPYVTITEGCAILTHGFDWSVLKIAYGEVIGSGGKVTIEENTFIGVNTTILKGCTIGPNTIIGAGSLVNRDIPGNVVAAGNPCKVICSLDDYYQKRQNETVHEAISIIRSYYERYHVVPDKDELSEFLWLFDRDISSMSEKYIRKIEYGSNKNDTIKSMMQTKPVFDTFEELCRAALEGYINE